MPLAVLSKLIVSMRTATEESAIIQIIAKMAEQKEIVGDIRDAITEGLKSVKRIRNDVLKAKLTTERFLMVKTLHKKCRGPAYVRTCLRQKDFVCMHLFVLLSCIPKCCFTPEAASTQGCKRLPFVRSPPRHSIQRQMKIENMRFYKTRSTYSALLFGDGCLRSAAMIARAIQV